MNSFCDCYKKLDECDCWKRVHMNLDKPRPVKVSKRKDPVNDWLDAIHKAEEMAARRYAD